MDVDIDTSRMAREIHTMPEEMRTAIEACGLMEAYRRRPPYQQNDYVGWITRAKLPATRASASSRCWTSSKPAGSTCT